MGDYLGIQGAINLEVGVMDNDPKLESLVLIHVEFVIFI